MINAARRLASELYTTCKTAKRKVPAIRRSVRFSETVMQAMPHGSIETLLLEKCDSIKVVEAHFEWMDVGNASDLAEFGNNIKSECVIKNDCDNVNIINNAPKRLVVANDLRDLVVVNTDDATYISSKKSADNIKQIMKDNMDTYEAFSIITGLLIRNGEYRRYLIIHRDIKSESLLFSRNVNVSSPA